MTNNQGIATVFYAWKDSQTIGIEVLATTKEQCDDDVNTTFNDVKAKGFISNPSAAEGIWCPAKVSRKLKAIQKQITIQEAPYVVSGSHCGMNDHGPCT